MIKINLLGDDTAVDNTGKLFVSGYVLSLILLGAVLYVVHSSYASAIEKLTLESESREKELKDLQVVTKEVRDLEAKEKEYDHKIQVIAGLKKSKIGPVRVLDDLNSAIPERAWITEVKEEQGLMRIDGKAFDNQTIAQFLKDLDKSNYFASVDLGETRQIDERGVKIKSFSLSSNVSYAGLPPKEEEATVTK